VDQIESILSLEQYGSEHIAREHDAPGANPRRYAINLQVLAHGTRGLGPLREDARDGDRVM
jgi:hypothetical protein